MNDRIKGITCGMEDAVMMATLMVAAAMIVVDIAIDSSTTRQQQRQPNAAATHLRKHSVVCRFRVENRVELVLLGGQIHGRGLEHNLVERTCARQLSDCFSTQLAPIT